MNLSVYYEDIQRFKFNKTICFERISTIIKEENKQFGPINLIFCSDNYLIDINSKYLKHNYKTDIISFNYNVNSLISGDLFIGIEQVKQNAIEYGQEIIVEINRVIFHGVLHLLDYDDKTENQKIIMTQMENKFLKRFGLIE